MDIGETVYVEDRKQWRAWLSRNHAKKPEIWLVFYRKATGKPSVPYNDAVEEALCFGWIDSIEKGIDRERFAQRFTPRRAGSKWSEMNKERARRLLVEGKMTAAGLAVAGEVLEESKLEMAPDIVDALKSDPTVWKNFQAFPAAYKTVRIGWIEGARKRPEEFQKRLRYFMDMTRQNKRYGMVQ